MAHVKLESLLKFNGTETISATIIPSENTIAFPPFKLMRSQTVRVTVEKTKNDILGNFSNHIGSHTLSASLLLSEVMGVLDKISLNLWHFLEYICYIYVKV